MPYKIKTYTKNQAKKIGVIVKPSSSKGKKIDVFKKGVKVASVGAIGYNDYPTYMELERKGKVSKGTAKLRRKLYKIRHKKDRNIKNSNGYYADKLLW
ncbi:MAG: hypothetical protein P1U44_14900 [Vicingaceae bacterium]|jgi:hypothetical protein|nr:hypothetical protein [Vicingaceae bacterium]